MRQLDSQLISVSRELTLWSVCVCARQVYSISPSFVPRVMLSLVEHVMDEISRLFQCVPEFSRNGALQVSDVTLQCCTSIIQFHYGWGRELRACLYITVLV